MTSARYCATLSAQLPSRCETAHNTRRSLRRSHFDLQLYDFKRDRKYYRRAYKAALSSIYLFSNKSINTTSCGAKAQQTPPRVAHRGIARFLGIDPKLNEVVPWSLHTFPENFMQIGPAVFS